MKAFLLGSNYRYSPVSPLHLFGRDQDIALQRTRRNLTGDPYYTDGKRAVILLAAASGP